MYSVPPQFGHARGSSEVCPVCLFGSRENSSGLTSPTPKSNKPSKRYKDAVQLLVANKRLHFNERIFE